MPHRHLLATIVAAVTTAFVAATAYAVPARSGLVVQGTDVSRFPAVTLRLMLPPEITRDGKVKFEVKENGALVQLRSATPLPADRKPAAVVLVIDTSGSMKGQPLDAAKRAASQFIQLMRADDQVAVVSFSASPRVESGFTSDRGALNEAVGRLRASGETALYDGLMTAGGLAATSKIQSRNIVLLSDGGDTQSVATFDATLQFVKQLRVPVFALGLESPEMDRKALDQIALQARGRSVPVKDASALESVYAGVAQEIQNQYEVTFRSAGPNTKDLELDVEAASSAGRAGTLVVIENPAFATPIADLSAPTRPETVLASTSGSLGLLAVVLVAALVFAAVTMLVFAVLALVVPEPNAMQQLAYYDQPGSREVAEDVARPGGVRGRLLSAVGYVGARRGFTQELQQRLERAGLPLRPVEYMFLHLVAVCAAAVVAQVFLGSLVLSVLVVVAATVGPLVGLDVLANRRKAAFESQLPNMLSMLAGSLRAGYGLLQGVELLVREMPPPASTEFDRVQTEARLGLPVEGALEKMADRMDSDDFRWTVSAISIQREVGGNLAEVLDIVAATIRERETLKRQVSALTAEGRLSAVVLVILPFIVAGALFFMSPGYIMLLFVNPVGWFLIGLAVVLMLLGSVWIRRVIAIEV